MTEEEKRAHTRLMEHARYCRRKALGQTSADPTKPARMTIVGGKSQQELREERRLAKAERKALKAVRKKLRKEAERVAIREMRHTPEYRAYNNAYMRWYNHRTPELRRAYEEARVVWRRSKGMDLYRKVKASIISKINGGEE